MLPDAVAQTVPNRSRHRESIHESDRTTQPLRSGRFVALYATHHRDGDGYVNISAPIPGGVDTVLRPENLSFETGSEDRTGVRLTTDGAGDPGLYLRTPLGPFEVPGGQEFRVWPTEGESGAAHLRATHERWLLGRMFLRIEYGIERAA